MPGSWPPPLALGNDAHTWKRPGARTAARVTVPAVTLVRIVLGEDSYLAREGIVSALEAAGDVELLASCEDVDSLREAVDEHRPDVVLTDIRMPPTNTDEGIRLAEELRTRHPEIGVVVISQHSDPLYAITLFEGGSAGRGYLLKESVREPAELSRALHEAAAGRSVVDPRIVERLIATQRQRQSSPLDTLTPREHEILAMIAEGRSNTAIAEALVITKRAVEGHINAIFAKLDLGDSEDVSRRVKAALVYLTGTGATVA
jgi:DNA-binding NarL/FixJ family response regulator